MQKIEEPQQRGRRKQTDDGCADDAAGDDDHADADAPLQCSPIVSNRSIVQDFMVFVLPWLPIRDNGLSVLCLC